MKRIFFLLLASLFLPQSKAQNLAPQTPPTEASEYITTVQRATFRYFWDFAHPVSGMAPERNATPNIVTSGGTGFGVQAIVVGAYRGWVDREEVVERLLKMVKWLEKAERFHGAWSHWLDGTTGKVVPFSEYDDGGDLVETSYLVNGLLVAKAFFDANEPKEMDLRKRITRLCEAVEWDWYVHDGLLLWHWSPTHGWKMNHAIGGYNECLITHLLALGSPTHPVSREVYDRTWKQKEAWHFVNGKEFFGYTLPIGFDMGGPLFFEHYTYLSLDPRLMQDEHCNYWNLVLSHTLLNRAYCIHHAPKEFGYHEENWGLTASDNHLFYGAHQPSEDNGTISPTAALSSMPYTPWYSYQVLMNLYRRKGNPLFGELGFFDAYNQKEGWFSNQYLAIDQGPIVVMLENYRSGLCWKLGQGIPELQEGMKKAGIQKPNYPTGFTLYLPEKKSNRVQLMRHPDENKYHLDFTVAGTEPVTLELTGQDGKKFPVATSQVFPVGINRVYFTARGGDYSAEIRQGKFSQAVQVGLR